LKFKDKIAIVTGATRGIGRAIALELAKQGAIIIFTYLKNDDLAKQLVFEIEKLDSKAHPHKIDIRDYEKTADLVEKIREKYSRIDLLVNNAGITRDKTLMMMDEKEWQEVIDTNLTGCYNMTKACIVTFMRQKRGSIVNITSVSGMIGLPGQTNYSASKAGIIGFTKALAKEVAPFNIRVNAVAGGFIETDMTKDLKDKVISQIPLARFGKPQEVAKVVSFLLSDEAGYITGEIIKVDGGLAIC
jgi:3-oxoacyl-[acyl-carrier protein] reductase